MSWCTSGRCGCRGVRNTTSLSVPASLEALHQMLDGRVGIQVIATGSGWKRRQLRRRRRRCSPARRLAAWGGLGRSAARATFSTARRLHIQSALVWGQGLALDGRRPASQRPAERIQLRIVPVGGPLRVIRVRGSGPSTPGLGWQRRRRLCRQRGPPAPLGGRHGRSRMHQIAVAAILGLALLCCARLWSTAAARRRAPPHVA